MATQYSETVGVNVRVGAFAEIADRWIYVFMAALFFVTVLTGFIPTSIQKLAAVEAGERMPLPGFMHFHALMMGTWITLLLAQTTLMATGKRGWHMKLGLVSVALVPAILVSMVGVSGATFTQLATIPAGAMPAEALNGAKVGLSNIVLEQIRVVLVFPAFIMWALLVRREDPETHKRLMILATLPPLSAAIDRIAWLPNTAPDSPVSIYITQLMWLAPVLIYDLWRRGRLHRAYVVGIGLNLPLILFSYFSWGADWWLAMAPQIFGIQDW